MHTTRYDLQHETDDHLLTHLSGLIAASNSTTADVLAHLAEIDRRKLYAPQGYSSLFAYAMSLGLSESAVYKRIQCARLARRLPVVFDVVAKGDVHLFGSRPPSAAPDRGEPSRAARRSSPPEQTPHRGARGGPP